MAVKNRRYSADEKNFILEYSKTHTCKETSERFNELFGRSTSPQTISTYRIRHGEERKLEWYTDEQDEWLRENVPNHGRDHIAREFNKKFGTNRSSGAIAVHCCDDLHITRSEEVKRRIISETHPLAVPIGTISKRKFSEKSPRCELLWIKVKDSTENGEDTRYDWIPLARYIWEGYYGPIPKGYSLTHINRDYCDCRITNLALLSPKERGYLINEQMYFDEPELMKSAIVYAKLRAAIKERSEP